jgi:hypothetical protein
MGGLKNVYAIGAGKWANSVGKPTQKHKELDIFSFFVGKALFG